MQSQIANPNIAQTDTAIRQLRFRYFGRLRFIAPLESHFEETTSASRSQRMANQGWLMTATYLMLMLADRVCIPSHFSEALILRSSIAVVLFLGSEFVIRRPRLPWINESALVLASCIVAVSNFVLYQNVSPDRIAATQLFTLITLLGANIVLRFRFPFAVATTAIIIAMNTAYLVTARVLSRPDQISWSVAVLWGALFILIASYSLERQERLNFLLQLRYEQHSNALTTANTELVRLSSQDALTGLANRAAFNQRFVELWHQAATNHTPLSAVLIDIDHFKVVNDTRGHLFGDEVLKRVATLLLQSLRGKNDFAARYGGEEFLLLLPETDLIAAHKVAERIRSLVQIAGSPPTSGTGNTSDLWTTVSCGVATVIDTTPNKPLDLVHAADKALYAAKAAGRNRTHTAPELNRSTPPLSTLTPIITT